MIAAETADGPAITGSPAASPNRPAPPTSTAAETPTRN